VELDFGREDAQGAPKEPAGAIRMGTSTSSFDQTGEAVKSLEGRRIRRAAGEGIGVRSECSQPELAWAALPGALSREVSEDAGGLDQPAARGVEEVEDARPERRACWTEAGIRKR
jgi:hypothetical protein